MDDSIVTYSRSMNVVLSRWCRNECNYCEFRNNEETLQVPYALIKDAKAARKMNAKEAYIMASERPDHSHALRAKLDIWGFESYVEYINTVCELLFLEDLLPHLDVGTLTEEEVKVIRRICTSITVMMEAGDDVWMQKNVHSNAPYKTLESRIKTIQLAGAGKLPVTTGIIVGMGESMKSREQAFKLIKDLHLELKNIQNVMLQNFVPYAKGMPGMKPPSKIEMLETVKLARKILPEDVVISVPLNLNHDFMPFVKAGVRDFGHVAVGYDLLAPDSKWPALASVEKELKTEGYGFQRRLPIFSRYLRDNWYSRKLAQMLDKYRFLMKQAEEQEQAKLLKASLKPVKASKAPKK